MIIFFRKTRIIYKRDLLKNWQVFFYMLFIWLFYLLCVILRNAIMHCGKAEWQISAITNEHKRNTI
jgi:hypothetical protein